MRPDILSIAVATIPRPKGLAIPITEKGATMDIVAEIKVTFAKGAGTVKNFAEFLRGRNDVETCRNVWQFVKTYIVYKKDPIGVQYIKTPAQTFADRFGDCKSYAIFICSLLTKLGIKNAFRFASYAPGELTHVYALAFPVGYPKTFVLDACLDNFDSEKLPVKTLDIMTQIIRLEGPDTPISEAELAQPELSELVHGAAFNYDKMSGAGVCDAEIQLSLVKQEIQGYQEMMAGFHGFSDPRVQVYGDMTDYVSDLISANGDPVTIAALEGEWNAGGYNVAAILAAQAEQENGKPIASIGLLPLLAFKLIQMRKDKKTKKLIARLRAQLMACKRGMGQQGKNVSGLAGISAVLDELNRVNGFQGIGSALGADPDMVAEVADVMAAEEIASTRDLVRKMRWQRVHRVCNCHRHGHSTAHAKGQMMADTAAAPLPASIRIHGETTINALPIEETIRGINDEMVNGISGAEIEGIEGDESVSDEMYGIGFLKKFFKKAKAGFKKLGKGLKKFGKGLAKVAKKVGKGLLNLALLPMRLLAKGVLEVMDKAGGGVFFMYTFLTEAQAQMLGPKVAAKRKKQMKFKNFIVKAIGWKESRFNKMVRNGIQKKFKTTPERWLQGMIAKKTGKVSGIGDIGFVNIIVQALPVVFKIIKKLVGLFKKKGQAPEDSPEDSAPNPEADIELKPENAQGVVNDLGKQDQANNAEPLPSNSASQSVPFNPSGGGGGSYDGGGLPPDTGGGGSAMRESGGEPTPTDGATPPPEGGNSSTIMLVGAAALAALFMFKK